MYIENSKISFTYTSGEGLEFWTSIIDISLMFGEISSFFVNLQKLWKLYFWQMVVILSLEVGAAIYVWRCDSEIEAEQKVHRARAAPGSHVGRGRPRPKVPYP